MNKTRDDLFASHGAEGAFQFNDKVAEVFDDMLARSVPCYSQVIAMVVSILAKRLVPDDEVYDLGCSTGNTLIELSRSLGKMDIVFTGIDSSAAMIAKAECKAAMYSRQGKVQFRINDILQESFANAGAVLLHYTLQFVEPERRQELLTKICTGLRPGGVLLLSEKVVFPDAAADRDFGDFYLDFKREQGYSELEISRKREALENVLIPLTIEKNRALLKRAGFSSVETFFQWFNFVSFMAVR